MTLQLPEHVWLKRGTQAAAIASWVLDLAISFAPGTHASLTGHVLAYAFSAAVTRLAFTRGVRSRWQIVGFIAIAGLMEIVQIFIPNHCTRISDWLASSAGAIVGVVLARTFAHEVEAIPRKP